MPLRKPKPVKLPKPFEDLETSPDDDKRRRALLIKREMDRAEGFSWNRPRDGLWHRLTSGTRDRAFAAAAALGMGALIVSAFAVGTEFGITAPLRMVYVESWRQDRTADDAVADREARMAELEAAIARNRRALEEAEARQQALEAERLAARRAAS